MVSQGDPARSRATERCSEVVRGRERTRSFDGLQTYHTGNSGTSNATTAVVAPSRTRTVARFRNSREDNARVTATTTAALADVDTVAITAATFANATATAIAALNSTTVESRRCRPLALGSSDATPTVTAAVVHPSRMRSVDSSRRRRRDSGLITTFNSITCSSRRRYALVFGGGGGTTINTGVTVFSPSRTRFIDGFRGRRKNSGLDATTAIVASVRVDTVTVEVILVSIE